MIFSLLKLSKKTSAALSGIAIGAASLWGISEWQDISAREMASLLTGTVALLGGTIIAALLLVFAVKLIIRIVRAGSKLRSDPHNKPVDQDSRD